jgi:tRNA(Ile)-lysidine synthase
MGTQMSLAGKIMRRVRRTIIRYRMVRAGERVVVAVSGGADSVCLLDMLHTLRGELNIDLGAAHFDHGLRPGEDEAETRFVRSLAESWGVPFETGKAPSGVSKARGSLEENLREARYRFLEGVMERCSANRIALGHHLNDQAETVLMRLLRGSGPSGLAGIPPQRGRRFIRPLIEVTRADIESYLLGRDIRYMTDPTNFEPRHLRNRIRLELIPVLETYQPRIVPLLGRMSEIMRQEAECLDSQARDWIQGAGETGGHGEIRIPVGAFGTLPEALKSRVIRQALEITAGNLRRVSWRHIESVKGVAGGERPQKRIDLPHGLSATRVYGDLVIRKAREKKREDFCYFLDGPGMYHLEAVGGTVLLEEKEPNEVGETGTSPWTAFLNAERIAYPLVLRNFRPGDRFVPLGMKGHKKVKDLFIDLKVPFDVRSRTPILITGKTPAWVCGLRIDDRFKVTPSTIKVLKVAFKAGRESGPFRDE